MERILKFQVLELSEKYNESFKDIIIYRVSSNINPKDHALIFYQRFDESLESGLDHIKNSLIVLPKNASIKNNHIKENNQILYVDNPRKEYAVLLKHILIKNKKNRKYKELENHIIIGENVKIGKNTKIDPFVFIDHDVNIGDDCQIEAGVRICSYVDIGNDTIIRQNSILGGQGFGVEKDENGTLIKIPHIGGLIIGDHVEIGGLSCIVGGTIEPTIIESNVMIDDCVMIAHNCRVKEGTAITGSVGIGGSVIIGKNCYIGSGAILKDHITIGDDCTVGLCSAVMKSLKNNTTVSGNPAETLEKMYLKRKVFKKIINHIEKK